MEEFAERLGAAVESLGPAGLFAVALADSAFIPLPQGVDALLIALAIADPGAAYPGAALAIVGSVLGSLVLYSIARRGGQALLRRRFSPAGLARLERWMGDYGAAALLPPVAIPLPLPMKPMVLAAGAFQMGIGRFIAAVSLGRFIRYFGEAYLARSFGDETAQFLQDNALIGLAAVVGLAALFVAVNRWSASRVERKPE